ncbi:MAG: tRNA pseudouridine(38-40) synthase TruA [Planctomycetota bacterium]|nr:MAG: tRNA pseudouridine(38-40) synthase TruA [Planctomycetota bacterium]
MQRNILLLLAYDGTDFHGWQKQPGFRTVQDVLEQAVRRVVRHQVIIMGSGRTDAGVHASGQVANFETTCEIPCKNICKAVGSRLPKDVSLYHVCEVSTGFRASMDAISKLYRYTIYNDSQRPVERQRQRYVYHFWHRLSLERMREAADYFLGEHDFAAFATQGHQRESTVRRVLRCEVYRYYDEIRIDVEGEGFLYNQVRNMVGTLIEIGRGRWEPTAIEEIMASRDRSNAGPMAPARGLCLQWVRYDMTGSYLLGGERYHISKCEHAEATDDGSDDNQ